MRTSRNTNKSTVFRYVNKAYAVWNCLLLIIHLPLIHWSFCSSNIPRCVPLPQNPVPQIFVSSLLKYHLLREVFLDYPT